jgi:metal-dependent HD superfamily phosphatase/phosphodiesterase
MTEENLEPMQALPEEAPAHGHYPIKLPTRHNPKLQALVDAINADGELYALWECANVNAVNRLGMSDHGPVHVRLIANIALKLLRLLVARDITPNIVSDHHLQNEEAEVVVSLAALMHDLGMSIHRRDHEQYSLFVAQMKLRELLPAAYPDPHMAAIVRSEILHAIIAHRSDGHPLTLEAGVVRVADALDMSSGRSRIPFESGVINIHSLSAYAIEKVEIAPGASKPIRISIHMNNSAGIFQVDELLKDKLRGSGLEQHIEVEASIEGEAEKKLIQVFRL